LFILIVVCDDEKIQSPTDLQSYVEQKFREIDFNFDFTISFFSCLFTLIVIRDVVKIQSPTDLQSFVEQ